MSKEQVVADEEMQDNSKKPEQPIELDNEDDPNIEQDDEMNVDGDAAAAPSAEEEQPLDENMVEGEEGEDPVVQKFEVFLSHNLTNNLFLFQYPLRPQSRPYDLNSLRETRFKKEHKKVDLDFELNRASEHFDQNQHNMECLRLSSTSLPLKANYAIGILRGNQLHITPLQNILQFRPNMDHLNESLLEQIREVKPSKEDKKNKNKQEEQAPQQPLLSTPHLRTKEEEAELAKSFSYIKKKEDEEKPIILENFAKDSVESGHILEQLFVNTFNEVKFDMSVKTYLDTLVPYKEDALAELKKKHISLDSLKQLPALDQVKLSMIAAKTLHYSRVKELCSNVKSDEQLLSYLEQVAIFTRGRWIVRSEYVEPNYPRFQACRDYMLYLFETQGFIKRREFAEKTKIPDEKIKNMLNDVSVLIKNEDKEKKDRVWEIKIPADEEFQRKYPEIVVKQQKDWKLREPSIMKNVQQAFKHIPIHKVIERSASGSSNMMHAAPRISSSDDVERAFKAFVEVQLRNFGVANNQLLRQQLAITSQSKQVLKSVNDEIFNRVLNQVAMPFKDYGYILREGTKPEYEKYRKIIIAMFDQKKTLKKNDITAEIKEKMNEDISPAAYSHILKELAVSKSGAWVPKAGSGIAK